MKRWNITWANEMELGFPKFIFIQESFCLDGVGEDRLPKDLRFWPSTPRLGLLPLSVVPKRPLPFGQRGLQSPQPARWPLAFPAQRSCSCGPRDSPSPGTWRDTRRRQRADGVMAHELNWVYRGCPSIYRCGCKAAIACSV